MQSANMGDNYLTDCAETIRARYSRAKSASRDSLLELLVVGQRLNDAKDLLAGQGRGAFGKWIDACQFPFDKTWRARLMKLAANWDAIREAIEALPEDRQKWTVDGALAIWAAAQRSESGEEETDEGDSDSAGSTRRRSRKETEAERLRRELAEALKRVEELEAENARLKGTGRENSNKEKADKKAGGPSIDAATRKRVKSVYALYKRPGTEAEGASARGRLEAIAQRYGMSLEDLLRACGLEP